MDPEATRYNAFLSVEEPRQELIMGIRGMMQVSLSRAALFLLKDS